MIRLQQKHLDDWRKALEQDFEDRLVDSLRKHRAQDVAHLSPADLRGRVREGIGRARGYGIDIEQDVAAFVSMTFFLGERFDTDPDRPRASALLQDRRLTGRQKIAGLLAMLEGLAGVPSPAASDPKR